MTTIASSSRGPKTHRASDSQGKGVIFVSSELPELLGIADRILVMANGRFTGEFTRAEATQESLMHAAIGETVSA